MKIIFLLTLCVSLAIAGDWPQFKQTPSRYGCDLTESITLPSKLCLLADFGSPIFAPPSIADNKAYAIASNGLIACINLTNNTVVWSRKLGGVNNESTPSIMNGKVYVGTKDRKFQILDADNGTILNTYDAGGPIFSSPLLLESGVYFGSFDSTFHALDLDGNLKWTYKANVNIIHAACYYDNTILFVDGDDKMFWAKDSGVFRTVQLPVGDPQAILTPPVVWRDTVYLGRDFTELSNAGLWLYNFQTGAELKRKLATTSQVRTAVSVDTSTGYIFGGGNNGGLFSMQVATAKWSTLPKTETHPPTGTYRVNSSPAVISNCIIAGTEDEGLCFYNKSTGSELWSYEPTSGKPISSAPAVSNGRVVVGSSDGRLYGFWDGTEVSTALTIPGAGTTSENKMVNQAGEWKLQLFPNPALGGNVQFTMRNLPVGSQLAIYSLDGKLLAKLQTQTSTSTINWNGRADSGKQLPSGNYLVKLTGSMGTLLKSFRLQIIS
jgi:outer membrane protein assembly factor BamB